MRKRSADPPKPLHYADAKAKGMAYCVYQERSRQQLRDKLAEWGQEPDAIERLLAELEEENYLNEERFARAYAGGKFRQKRWGRYKILQGLKQHRVAAPLQQQALQQEIDPDVYWQTLLELLEKKAATESERNPALRRSKLARYAISKGYEQDLVWDALKELGE
ncbi:regulatory protein RecX [Cesiribacter andamanensis]|uniref:Regulatory protein RecX n=1 Tax=Cesiribacter andamanensis AMV16 TaxID=1279009 RepID=M7N7W8_9BACT|nr:RecX family transcriptional regulator [Cesiribacter andamanensis]EMR04698.1 recombination regulator RecX [Cesiribacter andamanensis AMV16]